MHFLIDQPSLDKYLKIAQILLIIHSFFFPATCYYINSRFIAVVMDARIKVVSRSDNRICGVQSDSVHLATGFGGFKNFNMAFSQCQVWFIRIHILIHSISTLFDMIPKLDQPTCFPSMVSLHLPQGKR